MDSLLRGSQVCTRGVGQVAFYLEARLGKISLPCLFRLLEEFMSMWLYGRGSQLFAGFQLEAVLRFNEFGTLIISAKSFTFVIVYRLEERHTQVERFIQAPNTRGQGL